MFGVEFEQIKAEDNKIIPIEAENVKIISMEFLLEDKSSAIIWRGPIKIKALQQLISDVAWGDLDYLIVDLPPGSSDEPLSIVQTIKDIDGMVIVTTPQQVSLLDVSKSINFAEVTKTPIIGIVENMSGFACPKCGEITNIFMKDGGKNIANQLSLEFLNAIPLIPAICEAGDVGRPAVEIDKNVKIIFQDITKKIIERIEEIRKEKNA